MPMSRGAEICAERNFDVDLENREMFVAIHLHVHTVAVDLYMLGNDAENFFPQDGDKIRAR